MKVLIAIDAAPSSKSVVRAVVERPWPQDIHFVMISVVDPFVTAHLAALAQDAENAAQAAVAYAEQELRSGGLSASIEIVNGHPATTILHEALTQKADLVMVGSHGAGAVPRFLLGSTALHVLRGAACSAEIVRRADARIAGPAGVRAMRILLATDGSAYSLAAAESVAQRPWPAGSAVRVICVPETLPPLSDNQISNVAAWEELLEMRLSQANDAAEEACRIFSGSKLQAHSAVPKADLGVKATILDEADAWKADLIVLGSHGRRGMDRFWMGSVSEAVAMNARCSVEVIRAARS